MALYVISWLDKPNSLDLRLSVRPEHLAYIKDCGKARLGGPYLNEQGQPIGSMMIVEVADEAEARALHAADPYVKAGLVPSADIRLWTCVAGPLA